MWYECMGGMTCKCGMYGWVGWTVRLVWVGGLVGDVRTYLTMSIIMSFFTTFGNLLSAYLKTQRNSKNKKKK